MKQKDMVVYDVSYAIVYIVTSGLSLFPVVYFVEFLNLYKYYKSVLSQENKISNTIGGVELCFIAS